MVMANLSNPVVEILNAQNVTADHGNNDSDSLSCHWPQEAQPFPTDLQHFPALWISIIGRPILISLGTIGGLLIFLVQMREKKKATTNVYLMVMSLSSIFLMWSTFPNYVLLVWRGNLFTSGAWDAYPNLQKFNGFITFMQESAICISDLTLVVFSVERLLCTLNPFRYLNVFTLKRALYTELLIIVTSLLWNSPYLVIFNKRQQDLSPSLQAWNATMTKVDVVSCVSIWMTLLVINILLTRAMASHARARQGMVSESQSASAKRSSSKSRTSSILLLCSAVIYSVTQFPFLIYNLLTMAEEPPHCWINIPQKAVALALVFGENLSILGYAIDFFVYYLSSTGFRRQVRSLISGSRTNGQGSTFSSSECDGKRPLQSRTA
ncbi:hypothetical protein BV898_14764 [Hypsibius exemplaris]|uniref:G-protein coupled receptors family 1 profile domain-containing protein n=1 Tax=Hypsibius exemplaris TaxID=2072580 RepID=A0A9X6RJW1_HYPEX|nr:hypothetical protein BV898_14764 [Hypsibius exemplaris]